MKIYRTQDKQLTRATDFTEGVWVCMTAPTQEEVREVAATLECEGVETEILLEKTTDALGTKNMGLVPGNDIYVIRTSEAPAALVEVGFMTNPKELENLTDESYQKKCARAIYEGIMQALEEGY